VLLASLVVPATAQAPPEPEPPVLILRAARLLDVRSGRMLQPAIVVTRGERIAAVGSNVSIPDGALVRDLGDLTLLPGLIDAHTHLLADRADDYATMLLTKSQAYRALEGAAHARPHSARASPRCATSVARAPATRTWPCATP
jgi:imidazolonepropionase-like amidohydrolase